MAIRNLFGVHRKWEDWAGIALGLAILLSPWIARETGDSVVTVTTTGIGLMVVLLAEIGLVGLVRSVEYGELGCGLALIAWPFVMGYADGGGLGFWHFALGGLVALLASLELWQDWTLSDSELAAHADS
ncbi:unnamed protein product [Phaeothamnion confervicola]